MFTLSISFVSAALYSVRGFPWCAKPFRWIETDWPVGAGLARGYSWWCWLGWSRCWRCCSDPDIVLQSAAQSWAKALWAEQELFKWNRRVKTALFCRRTVVFVTYLKVRAMSQKWHKVIPHFTLLLLLMIMVLIMSIVMVITMIMMTDSDGFTSWERTSLITF